MTTTSRFLPQEIIRRKRDGEALRDDEIDAFVAGLTDGSVADAQVGAFAMAVTLKGMTPPETAALTRAMAHSGTIMDWSGLGLKNPCVDKHSTGGVGDKVSLILAPLVAACGAYVPMISGRGLGHTGGTLDKLESIPGYNATPSRETFERTVARTGCAIIGQTSDLAPADRRLYAIRDVTASVESIPLITASILSKKLAAGLDALVMDVKFGSGAFMPSQGAARELARSIVEVGSAAGLPTSALLTSMDQVLGRTAGNALEVMEAIDFLTARARDARLGRVIGALAVNMLVQAGLMDIHAAPHAVKGALDSGAAAERFAEMISSLGGPSDILEKPERHLQLAPERLPVIPERRGYVTEMDVRRIGLAIVALGGGRRRPEDSVDHGTGLSRVVALGAKVGPRAPLAVVYARTPAAAEEAARQIREAIVIGDEIPVESPVIAEG